MIRPTTIIEPTRLSRKLGVEVVIASETFQVTGSFKFRAAYNLASRVPHDLLITASSGNFGQALAYACFLLKKSCIVVMPMTSAQVKVDAVREYGGRVELLDVRRKSRQERVTELAIEHPQAYVASAYDDPLVIEGNASLGGEIAALGRRFDHVLAPIGGGGLLSGIVTGLRRAGSQVPVLGAEPLLGNDAARSLRAGVIVRNEIEPETIADGARTVSLGAHNWEILRQSLAGIIEVPEELIKQSVKVLYDLVNLKVEPTGALGVAALLTKTPDFRDRCVCCVVSGGNVDPSIYCDLIR